VALRLLDGPDWHGERVYLDGDDGNQRHVKTC
jgi:hypothetical protein